MNRRVTLGTALKAWQTGDCIFDLLNGNERAGAEHGVNVDRLLRGSS